MRREVLHRPRLLARELTVLAGLGLPRRSAPTLQAASTGALEVRFSQHGSRDPPGAGDQVMFGYACADTPDLMPAPITARPPRLTKRLTGVRKQGIVEGFTRQDTGRARLRQRPPGGHRHVVVRSDSA